MIPVMHLQCSRNIVSFLLAFDVFYSRACVGTYKLSVCALLRHFTKQPVLYLSTFVSQSQPKRGSNKNQFTKISILHSLSTLNGIYNLNDFYYKIDLCPFREDLFLLFFSSWRVREILKGELLHSG